MGYITNKQTVAGLAITSTPVAAQPIVTADMLSEYVFAGITLGGWFYIASGISLVLIIGLNGIKFYKQMKDLLKKEKVEG